jgi:beta-lactamase regulating signal transducer with metallopeptidase domain
VGIADFLLRILFWHIVPSLTSVLLVFGFLSLVSRLLKGREPNWLYWLFCLPLIKGVVILVRGTSQLPPTDVTKPIMGALRLWDPLNFISAPAALETTPAVFYSPTTITLAVTLFALLVSVLLWRWASLTYFYRSLARSEKLERRDAPRLFETLDSLVREMHTPYPEVIVSDKDYLFPCTIGIRYPVIVLSPELIEESSDEVLEAMLAHELAHLKRRDNVFHWLFVLLRDLLFFNPFAHLVFARAILAKEKDCDRIALAATQKPKALESAILNASLLAGKKQLRPLPGDLSRTGGLLSPGVAVKQRIVVLERVGGRHTSSVWAKALVVVLSAFAMLFNIHGFLVFLHPFLALQF